MAALASIATVVGAGATGESAMDASNKLNPMLARGELRLVGATTLDEFREHVEKDPALERRFQQRRVLLRRPLLRGDRQDRRQVRRRAGQRQRPRRRRHAQRLAVV